MITWWYFLNVHVMRYNNKNNVFERFFCEISSCFCKSQKTAFSKNLWICLHLLDQKPFLKKLILNFFEIIFYLFFSWKLLLDQKPFSEKMIMNFIKQFFTCYCSCKHQYQTRPLTPHKFAIFKSSLKMLKYEKREWLTLNSFS